MVAGGSIDDLVGNLDEAPLAGRQAGNLEQDRKRWAVQLGYRRGYTAAYAELGAGKMSWNEKMPLDDRGYRRIAEFQDRHESTAQAGGEACAVESDHAGSDHHVVFGETNQSDPGMAVDLASKNVEELLTASEQVRKHRPRPFQPFLWKLPISVRF